MRAECKQDGKEDSHGITARQQLRQLRCPRPRPPAAPSQLASQSASAPRASLTSSEERQVHPSGHAVGWSAVPAPSSLEESQRRRR